MSFLNASEPLGLPPGSVRAIIALMVNAVGCYLFATGQPISTDFVSLLVLVDGAYFITRGVQQAQSPSQPAEPAVPAPYISNEDQ